ncbi:MAG: lysoplasmalogenase family protein, partial [Spirochaetales bacterium]
MLTRQIVSVILYLLVVTLCLTAIKLKDSHLYAATKIFLMPLLGVVYFSFLPVSLRSVNNQIFVVFTLGFHTLGDLLLLFPRDKSKKFFYMGMVSFLAGHVFYALWFFKADVGHNRVSTVISVFVCLVLEYFLYRQLMLGPRKYAPKLMPYALGLGTVAVSITSTMGYGSPVIASVLSILGIILFCFSDYCIFRRLVRMPLFGQMMVMTTYIGGQTLIVAGMLLM